MLHDHRNSHGVMRHRRIRSLTFIAVSLGAIGAIEVAAQWIPHVVRDITLRNRKRGMEPDEDLLRVNRLYVACQTDDDLPYVLQHAGEDMIMIGSDYGHADNASELLALRGLREKGEVPPGVIDKILHENPTRFYGLSEN